VGVDGVFLIGGLELFGEGVEFELELVEFELELGVLTAYFFVTLLLGLELVGYLFELVLLYELERF
jgi:hypothetical protein